MGFKHKTISLVKAKIYIDLHMTARDTETSKIYSANISRVTVSHSLQYLLTHNENHNVKHVGCNGKGHHMIEISTPLNSGISIEGILITGDN